MNPLLYLLLGILFLWLSSELVVRSAQKLATKFSISGTFVGLTVLSIGTTLPELGTHIASSIQVLKGNNLSDIAVGANVGSNIFQITLILGLAGMYATLKTTKKFMHKDYLVMLGAIILLFVFSFNGILSRSEGIVLVVLYFVYLYSLGRQEHVVSKLNHNKSCGIGSHLLFIVLGVVVLYISSVVVVSRAEILAVLWGVSNSLVGVLLVGFGTALPELLAVVISLRRKMPHMSLGVLVGSNITNPFLGVGVGSIISTYTVSSKILFYDIPAWFIISLIAYFFLKEDVKMQKKEAMALIVLYLVYAGIRIYIVR